MTISSSEIKRNVTILLDGEVYQVLEWQHRQAPKAPPTLTIKARNLSTGNVFERKMPGNHKLTLAPTETRKCQYLFNDGENYTFMDLASYEQYEIAKKLLTDAIKFIKEGDTIEVIFYEERALVVQMPPSVVLEVATSPEGLRGDTQGAVTKPATTVTGLTLQVPLFVKEGDQISVSTSTGEYLGRV